MITTLIILATIFIVTCIGDKKRKLKRTDEVSKFHAQRELIHKILGTE